MFRKYFTVKEANDLLPYVKEELVHLQAIQKEFQSKYYHLQAIKKGSIHASIEKKNDIFLLEATIDFLEIQAKLYIKRLDDEGIFIKSIDGGLVDFPARVNGKSVLLCWRQGEEKVSYYHGIFDGFHGRKPISETDDE